MKLDIYYIYFFWFLGIFLTLTYVKIRLITSTLRNNWKEVLSLVSVIGLFLILNADVLFTDQYSVVYDNWDYIYPYFHFYLDALLQTRELPCWNPFLCGGQPTLIYTVNFLPFHLPHLFAYFIGPFVSSFTSTLLLFWWTIILENLVFSLGCYVLLRLLFAHWKYALFGFVVVLFSGITAGTLHVEALMASLFYIPWIWAGIVLLIRTRKWRWGLLSFLLLGFSLLHHYPQLVVYFWGILLISYVFVQWRDFKKFWTYWKKWVPVVVIGGCLVLVLILPLIIIQVSYSPHLTSPYRGSEGLAVEYQYVHLFRGIGSWNFHTLFHYLYPQTFFSLGTVAQIGQVPRDDLEYYIGLLPLFLVIYEIVYGTSQLRKVLILALGLMFFLALGDYSFGYYVLYKLVPFAKLHRIPLQLANYCNLFLIMLAVSGLQTLLQQKNPVSRGTTVKDVFFFLSFTGIVVGGMMMFGILSRDVFTARAVLPDNPLRFFLDETMILMIMGGVFLFLIRNRFRQFVVVAAFLVVLFDVGRYYHQTLVKNRTTRTPIISDLALPYAWQEYKSPFTLSPRDLGGPLLMKVPVIVLNGACMMVDKSHQQFIEQYRDLFVQEKNSKELLRSAQLIPKNQWDLFQKNGHAMLLNNITLPSTAIQVTDYQPNTVHFYTKAEQAAFLYYLDCYGAGWKVFVDGQQQPLLNVNSFKAVELPPGEHEVIFRYLPFWRWVLHLVLHVVMLGLGGGLLWLYWEWRG
jgi:hypothetical protein